MACFGSPDAFDELALEAIQEGATKILGSQKMTKPVEDGLALIILMARLRNDLRMHPEFSSGQTILHNDLRTDLGGTSVRTLSHLEGDEFSASTVFKTDDPFDEETLVNSKWNTAYRPDLIRIHDRSVACVDEYGFALYENAANHLSSDTPTSRQEGVELLGRIIPNSLRMYLEYIA